MPTLPLAFDPGGAFDPFLLLATALVLDAYLGEMRLLFKLVPHPVVAIGNVIGWFDRRLNRPERGATDRRVRGILVVVVLTGAAIGIGSMIQAAAAWMPYGWALELFVLVTLVAQRSLYDHVAAVARGLETEGLSGGRRAVAMIVGRDPKTLDEHGVSRAAIESCAENFSDGIVAPVFWYVILGLPGMLAYKTINTMDSMIGHKTDRYRAFGWAAARLDDLVNLIPARLAGLILAVGTAAAAGKPGRAMMTMLRDARKHRSPNAGWPEAAMAGGLDLALAGPRRYPGEVVDAPWIGSGRARADATDIRRALRALLAGCVLQAGVVLLLWFSMGQ
ncbi:adenosylcobinamide-phosphate synthase CbiB [Caenispirillum salinarum]|uniref:adenosylcobinamide-phosphate synthase CbiB n=1 Tax=Caenispirillum salinarum TaxID=859058 RepID=UPI003850E131